MSLEAKIIELAEEQGRYGRSKGAEHDEVVSICYLAGLEQGVKDKMAAYKKILALNVQGYIDQGDSESVALSKAFQRFFETSGKEITKIVRQIIASEYKHRLKEIKNPKLALIDTYKNFLWSNNASSPEDQLKKAMQREVMRQHKEGEKRAKKEISFEDLKEEPSDPNFWAEMDAIEAKHLLKMLISELKKHPYGNEFMTALTLYVFYGEPWDELARTIPQKELLSLKRKAKDLLLAIYY